MAEVGGWGNYFGWPLMGGSGPADLEPLPSGPPVEKHTVVDNRGWRLRFATIERLPSEITCLSHSHDYDGVFRISERYSSRPGAGHIAEGHIITRNDGR